MVGSQHPAIMTPEVLTKKPLWVMESEEMKSHPLCPQTWVSGHMHWLIPEVLKQAGAEA